MRSAFRFKARNITAISITRSRGERYSNQDDKGVRAQILGYVTPALTIRAIIDYSHQKEDCCARFSRCDTQRPGRLIRAFFTISATPYRLLIRSGAKPTWTAQSITIWKPAGHRCKRITRFPAIRSPPSRRRGIGTGIRITMWTAPRCRSLPPPTRPIISARSARNCASPRRSAVRWITRQGCYYSTSPSMTSL